jgi:predicted HicB family RNase H-like nuclease
MTDSEGMTKDEVLAKLREEIAELRRSANAESDPVRRADRLRLADGREAVIEDEAESIATEIAENQQTALSLRVPVSLSAALKARAEAERIPTSALVRRILTQALEQPSARVLTVEQVEEIARRVYRESA